MLKELSTYMGFCRAAEVTANGENNAPRRALYGALPAEIVDARFAFGIIYIFVASQRRTFPSLAIRAGSRRGTQ